MADRNAIHFVLDKFLYKEDVQELCDNLDLRVSGNKDDLIESLLDDSAFDPGEALAYLDKDQLKTLCDDLELEHSGTRDTLVNRVLGYLESEEEGEQTQTRETSPPPPPSPPPPLQYTSQLPGPPAQPTAGRQTRREQVFGQQPVAPEPLYFPPEQQSPTLIPESHAPQIAQLQLVQEFVEGYRPSRRFANEQAYEIEIAQAARAKFGDEAVRTQVTIYGGRIDLEILGIGIEIKCPNSRTQLQTLLGQTQIYRNSYGPNLMVLIFQDLAKQQDLLEFGNLLRQRGIPVFVK